MSASAQTRKLEPSLSGNKNSPCTLRLVPFGETLILYRKTLYFASNRFWKSFSLRNLNPCTVGLLNRDLFYSNLTSLQQREGHSRC